MTATCDVCGRPIECCSCLEGYRCTVPKLLALADLTEEERRRRFGADYELDRALVDSARKLGTAARHWGVFGGGKLRELPRSRVGFAEVYVVARRSAPDELEVAMELGKDTTPPGLETVLEVAETWRRRVRRVVGAAYSGPVTKILDEMRLQHDLQTTPSDRRSREEWLMEELRMMEGLFRAPRDARAELEKRVRTLWAASDGKKRSYAESARRLNKQLADDIRSGDPRLRAEALLKGKFFAGDSFDEAAVLVEGTVRGAVRPEQVREKLRPKRTRKRAKRRKKRRKPS